MKKIRIIIIICMCSILMTACAESCNEACYDEDWVPYENYTDDLNISIESNIYVNTENNKAYKIEYEKGASKRVATHSVELEKTLDIDAKDLYDTIVARELSDKSKDIKEACLVFHGDEINVSIYDKECFYKDTIKYED